jgi:hypothetical protein
MSYIYSGIIHTLLHVPIYQKEGMYYLNYIFPKCVPFSLEEAEGEAIQAGAFRGPI